MNMKSMILCKDSVICKLYNMNFFYKNSTFFGMLVFFILLFLSAYTGNWIYFGLILIPIMLFTLFAIFMRFRDFLNSTSETINTQTNNKKPNNPNTKIMNKNQKNPNYLFDYEKKSAQIIRDILESKRKNKDILNEINELSIIVYYLSFKRTNKEIVEIENIENTINSNEYYDVLGMTRSIFKNMADEVSKPSFIDKPILLDTCEKLILQVIQKNIKKLNSI